MDNEIQVAVQSTSLGDDFRQIVERMDALLMIQERSDGRVLYAGGACEAIFGRPACELGASALAWLDHVEPEDRDRLAIACSSSRERGPVDEECRIRRADGTLRWIRVRMFPLIEPDGSMRREICLVQDTTAKQELSRAQRLEVVGTLASSVAHDFNNVLQAVLGCLSLARDDSSCPPHVRRYLDRAAKAARRGSELSGQLMAFTRKQRERPRPIAVDPCVRSAAALCERLLTERIELEVHTGAADRAIVADPVQIEQIILNLATNARDAMPDGGTLTIFTEATEEIGPKGPKGLVRLVVQDNGSGMDEQTSSRIFEPFFTTKEPGRGTGLGLATVCAIAQQIGARVDVDTGLGRGTSFTVTIPCSEERPERPSQRPPATIHLAGTALLVDDDPLVRMTVRRYLEGLGLDVLDAESATGALAICERCERPIDVLVTDLVLPVMNGLRLAGRVREYHPALAVLLISANPEFLGEDSLTDDRMRLLSKPFGREELGAELASLLLQPSARRARDSQAGEERAILLVEDDAVGRSALAELLESSGYRVIAVARPSEALAVVRHSAERIDLVVTDLRLPEMSGDHMVAELRRSLPGLKTIYMSGLSEPPSDAGAFIQKPVDFDVLARLIARGLDQPEP